MKIEELSQLAENIMSDALPEIDLPASLEELLGISPEKKEEKNTDTYVGNSSREIDFPTISTSSSGLEFKEDKEEEKHFDLPKADQSAIPS